MNTKRILTAIAGVLLLFFVSSAARADEDVRITVVADPTELAEAGNVELSFTISNYSDFELHGVTISSGGVAFNVSDKELVIPASGSAYDIKLTVPVSDSQIGLPITFTVTWTQGGEPRSQDVPVTINRAADPVITLTRTIGAESAREGDTVTIEYTLTNNTKFDMSALSLVDENVSDTPISQNDTLRAGNSITIQHKYKMGGEDVVSAPVVMYTVRGKTKTFSAIEPLTIKLLLIKLAVEVQAGAPTVDGVMFTLEIKNVGNQTVSDITILDDRDNFVNATPFSLDEGDAATYTHLVKPVMTEPVRQVSFHVTGKDAQGGAYSLDPPAVTEVYPYVDDSQIATSIRAEILQPWSADTGTIQVRITIENASQIDLANVQISEQALGIVKLIEALDHGETAFDQTLTIGSPRNLSFSMRGVDPAGAMRELGSFSLPVAYSDATAAPAATPESAGQNGGLFAFLTGTLEKILIVLGVLMCISFAVLILLSVAERKRIVALEAKEEVEDAFENSHHYARVEILDEPLPPQGDRDRTQRTVRPLSAAPAAREREPAALYDPQETRRPERPAPGPARPYYATKPDGTAANARPDGEIPIEVEYDDEQAIEMGTYVDPYYEPVRLTDGTPQQGPKIIKVRENPARQAAQRTDIRRIQKKDDPRTNWRSK